LFPGTTTAGHSSSAQHVDADADAPPDLTEVAGPDRHVHAAGEFKHSLSRGHATVQVAEEEEPHRR